jgi:hypothetical protein
LSGRGHLERTGVDGRITLNGFLRIKMGAQTGSNWLSTEYCRPFVNAVMKFVLKKWGKFLEWLRNY